MKFLLKHTLRGANNALTFFLELVLLISVALLGYQTGSTTFVKLSLLLLFPVLIAIVWGLYAAPKAPRRLKGWYLVLLRGGLFLVAAGILYQLGYQNFALGIGVLTIGTQSASG